MKTVHFVLAMATRAAPLQLNSSHASGAFLTCARNNRNVCRGAGSVPLTQVSPLVSLGRGIVRDLGSRKKRPLRFFAAALPEMSSLDDLSALRHRCLTEASTASEFRLTMSTKASMRHCTLSVRGRGQTCKERSKTESAVSYRLLTT